MPPKKNRLLEGSSRRFDESSVVRDQGTMIMRYIGAPGCGEIGSQ